MILNANALHIPLADQSVHCIVTSPPYWALRDYGTAKWEGGELDCKHSFGGQVGQTNTGQHETSYIGGVRPGVNANICGKCGAIRIDNQLGLERTPEEYVANMVQVFRECWRVLRDDGTLWLNIGDSYAGGSKDPNPNGKQGTNKGTVNFEPGFFKGYSPDGLKPKDLVGIPWRLAFALQADGWYLRSDIIWSKPNPMPESVTDRPTKAHEYLFLLTKRERYYYDAEAVRESNSDGSIERFGIIDGVGQTRTWNTNDNKRDKRNDGTKSNEAFRDYVPAGRNRRTVWTIPTAPYKGAHFATFPPALVEPCIKAGTSERGVCPKCGKGWRRVVEKGYRAPAQEDVIADMISKGVPRQKANLYGNPTRDPKLYAENPDITLGWQPACKCDAGEPIPALVFDPFVGSGTTVKVAYDLGRRGVGLDLSLKYLDEQATTRIHNGHVGRLV